MNISRNRLRRRDVERRNLSSAAARQTQVAAPEDGLIQDDVAAAVRALPERQRAAIVLHYFEDLDENAIAEILGCSVGTVKSQLAKARSKLGIRLARREEVG
jgi:RNA polymerase sigma factor (sigma-70 family)